MSRPNLVLLQGGLEIGCCCDEPDVYDGYAECPMHPPVVTDCPTCGATYMHHVEHTYTCPNGHTWRVDWYR